MLRCQHVLETVGSGSQAGSSLFGNMRRVVVQNDSEGAVGRIMLIEILEQRDEFSAAMLPFHAGCDMTLMQVQSREDGTGSQTFCIGDRGLRWDALPEPGADRAPCWR